MPSKVALPLHTPTSCGMRAHISSHPANLSYYLTIFDNLIEGKCCLIVVSVCTPSDDWWGRASLHGHWMFIFPPLWRMTFYPCIPTHVLKSTLDSSLQKSSCDLTCRASANPVDPFRCLSSALGAEKSFLVAGEVILSSFYKPQETSDLQGSGTPYLICKMAVGTWVAPRPLCFSTRCFPGITLTSSPDRRARWCMLAL